MRAAAVLVPVLAALGIAQSPTERVTVLTPQHVMRLRHVTSVVPSPDGVWLAYTVLSERGPDEPPGGGRIEAFVMPTEGGEAQPFPGSSGLAWRPGTETLCWVARRDGDDAPQVWGRAVRGGPEQRITDTPSGVSSFAWRPDGAALAYTALDPEPELRAQNRARGFRPVVVDEELRHVSLWLWEPDGVRRLTAGATVQSFAWAPTGTHLAVGMSPRNSVDDSYMFTRLFTVTPDGTATKLVDNPGKLGQYAWSPDGTKLAYVSAADRNDPHAGMLYVADRTSGVVTGQIPDLAGQVNHVEWIDDDRLQVLFDTGVHTWLMDWAVRSQDEPGGEDSTQPITVKGRELPATTAFARVTGTAAIVFAASTAAHPAELFRLDVATAAAVPARQTTSNPELVDVTLGAQQVVTITASDGVPIEGIRVLPVGFREGTRYPLVIVAHGGPESHYQDGWLTRYSEPGQVLAGMGYVVWYPNYRSSTGYGVEFAKADHGDPMGREFGDHLDAIDRFDADGLIDRARVGIVGGSYGGYTAAWAATRHSEHFAAAVSFVPFVDIRTKWLTSDIPWEFYLVHYQERWPHEQPGFLADRSPLTWVASCRTPLLVCGGDADPRVHPSQPFMLYRGVKFATDTPCRYVQYPGEGHGNRQNVHRYDYMLRALRWLDHYLGGPDRRALPPPALDLEYPRW